MYVPRHFGIEDLSIMQDVMRANSFATLVSARVDGPFATHLPVLLDPAAGELGTLRAHVARANPHWRLFDGRAAALFIFQGPHGYVSPSSYAPGPAVPTWDYIAVHASGRPRLIVDESTVLTLLGELVHAYEADASEPWPMADQGTEYLRTMARGVVAFEMTIERLEGKAKLGQNRPADQEQVASALERAGNFELAHAIRRANALAAPA